jgi:hypothetical protein
MKKQFLVLCLMLLSICGYAQTITVKGTVTSASDKLPMIGATVQVKGAGAGTITGLDGDYILNNIATRSSVISANVSTSGIHAK